MKKLVIILLLVLPLTTHAQWLTSGSNIYNSNTGNVGVGTSSPTSKIEILGDGVNSFPLLIKNNASSVIGVYSASGNATWHSGFFSYKARGTVAAPSDVISGDRISGYYSLPYIGGAYRASAGMEFYVGTGTINATSFPTYILFGTTPNFGTTRLERMRITESGFVGINKTNPVYQLDVNGIVNATGLYVNGVPFSGGGGSSQWTTAGSNIYFNTGNVAIGTTTISSTTKFEVVGPATGSGATISASGGGDVLLNSGGSLFFDGNYNYGAGNYIRPVTANTQAFFTSGSERMRIASNGNIGIGTTLSSNPNGYKLAVNGVIGAKEVKVENTSTTWPDYVFDNEYKLSPLSEVEYFIKENKHLPEVPSANEIKKNGQALGEMNALLLKKVEELTLYLIDIKKEVNELKTENKSLRKEMESIKEN